MGRPVPLSAFVAGIDAAVSWRFYRMEIVGGTISGAKLVNIIFSAKFFALNLGNILQKDSGVKCSGLLSQ